MACDLDQGPLTKNGPAYLVTDDYWAATCCDCKVPMIWTKACTMDVPEDVLIDMRALANEIGVDVFGAGRFVVDEKQRKIHGHKHIHVRPLKEKG